MGVLEPLEQGGSPSILDSCITGGNSVITVGAVGAFDGRGFLSGGGSTHGSAEDFDVGGNGTGGGSTTDVGFPPCPCNAGGITIGGAPSLAFGTRYGCNGGGNDGEYGDVPDGFTRTHGGG